jgi:HK97 family phage prohead protease
MERLLETRSLNQFPELRAHAETDAEVIRIGGYGAVVNKFYDVFNFKERVAPGAFDKTLQEQPDIRGMFNHDPNFLLGRTASGTMDVSVDKRGLKYEIRADALDPQAVSVSRKIARGDVDGSSMAFFVIKEEWLEEKDKPLRRTILEVELLETGPVTMPASPSTTAKIARAMQDTGIDYDAINGAVVRKRAGFNLSPAEEDQIDHMLEFLSGLKFEPAALNRHSDGTADVEGDEIALSRQAAAFGLRKRLAEQLTT